MSAYAAYLQNRNETPSLGKGLTDLLNRSVALGAIALRLGPPFKHRSIRRFDSTRKAGGVHQLAGLHPMAQSGAQRREARQAGRQRDRFLDIFFFRARNPFRMAEVGEDRAAIGPNWVGPPA
jgi:hypothetical protein